MKNAQRFTILLITGCAFVLFARSRWTKTEQIPTWELIQHDQISNVYAVYNWRNICKFEWEQISTFAFLRRDSAFYMIDLKTIILLFVGHKDWKDDFDYNVGIFIDAQLQQTIRIRGKKDWFVHVFESDDMCFYKIQIPLDLLRYRSIKSESNLDELIRRGRIDVRIHVFDKANQRVSENALDLKFKYLHRRSTKKRSSMICNRCYYLKRNELKQLEWWFEMNKRAGYEQISICNNTLESSSPDDDDGYEALFKKYAGYVELIQMNCMPHFLSSDGKTSTGSHFVNSVYELVDNYGKFIIAKRYMYEVFALNMCYLRHAQDYRYITVIDVDEGIFPPLIQDQFYYHDNFYYVRQLSLNNEEEAKRAVEGLKCDRYSPSDLSMANPDYRTLTEQYVHEIISKDKRYKEPESLYFENAWQLTNESISKIMVKLEEFFNNSTLISNEVDYFISVLDETLETYEVHVPFYTRAIRERL